MQFVRSFTSLKSQVLVPVLLFLIPIAASAQRDDKSLQTTTTQNIQEDDTTGEDPDIRKAAIEALGDRAGTIVVMSPQSGRIYTIVNQEWAIRRGFKPCSTIKLVTAIAGFNENLIESNGRLSNGVYRLGLDDSLAYSNNGYFQKVGSGLGSRKMIDYAQMLGLGSPTGINAEGEYGGRLPFGNENLRIYSHADSFEVTPLQLAVMVSAITNGGNLVIPQIANTRIARANFRGFYRNSLNLKPAVYERVIPGMIGAVRYGTAKRTGSSNLQIAGKTGSCISNGTWVGLFASAAPVHDPKFSVIVITEGSTARGKHAAQIAGKIYNSLAGRFDENYKGRLARKSIIVGSANRENSQSIKRTGISGPAQDSIPSDIATNRNPQSAAAKNDKGTPKTNPAIQKTGSGTMTRQSPTSYRTIIIGGKSEITRPRIVKNR